MIDMEYLMVMYDNRAKIFVIEDAPINTVGLEGVLKCMTDLSSDGRLYFMHELETTRFAFYTPEPDAIHQYSIGVMKTRAK